MGTLLLMKTSDLGTYVVVERQNWKSPPGLLAPEYCMSLP